MKRKLKLLLVLLAVFCAALTLGLVTACVDEPVDYGDPAKDGYVITVLYPDGSPVKSTDSDSARKKPAVELTDKDGNRIDPDANAQINDSGIATINYFVPGEYYINVINYPSGYTFDGTSVKTSANKAYYTVKLKLGPPTPYTVSVLEPDGETPMSNVPVKLMTETEQVASATTDADGLATTDSIERGVYKIVLDLPQGYGYKAVSTGVGAKTVNITTVKLTDINFDDKDKLDADGIQPWDDALNYEDLKRFDIDGDCYAYTAEFEANQEVFFKIHAPKTGAYTIASKQGNDYEIKFYSDDLTYFDDSLSITSETNEGNNTQEMQIKEGKTLTFSVRSHTRNTDQGGTVELLICLPVPEPSVTEATQVGEWTLAFDNFNVAILKFITSKNGQGFGMGQYRITSLSDKYDVMLVECSINTNKPVAGEGDLPEPYVGCSGNDNGADDGRNFVFINFFPFDYLDNIVPYHIIIKDTDVSYPTQIKVKIERIGDAIPPTVTEHPVSTTVNTPYTYQGGDFNWMPVNGSLETVRHDDGNWYVKVNGEEKALVVAITKTIRDQVYSFSNVEYFGSESGEDSKPTSFKQNSYLTVYEVASDDTKYNYSEFIEHYEGLVNGDGVYQVNDELKLFLERYMDQHYADITGSATRPNQPWLLGCGYYATDLPEVAD